MRKSYVVLLVVSFFSTIVPAQVIVQSLLTENLVNPIGLQEKQPRFSWQLASSERNVLQTAYEIRIYTEGNTKKWNSGKVISGQSVQVPYQGEPLQPGVRYFWQVRVTDNSGKTSAWSAPAHWQAGMLNTDDWKAIWIAPGYKEPATHQPSPLLRKTFENTGMVKSAVLYITAHGLYEARINGTRVGDAYLAPGWTSYNKRLQYQAYDVTSMIRKGENALGVMLGSGWYRGHLAWDDNKNIYGKDVSLLLQLELTYANGQTKRVVSDGSWKSATGEITSAEIYDGETIDARNEKQGWSLPGYQDGNWNNVITEKFSNDNLIGTQNEPIRKHEIFKAIKVITTPKGEKVLDFGQNMVGWVIVNVKGKAGDTITISHAEVLDKAGNFYTDNLRAAKSQDNYILKGGVEEIFEPHFTFHGFRYIRIEGLTGEIHPDHFTAVTLYSDMKKTGSFTSSNTLINQLQHNIEWGQRGNFLDMPTDCPQRDERLGWTGDAQVFSRTAAFNMGVDNFFAKWLKDVAADQDSAGRIPFVIPNVLGAGSAASAGWSDACTIIPWNMYLAYGDHRILEQQYPSMKAWVDYMQHKSINNLWNTGFHFGDWLFYRPQDDNDGRSAVTDKYLIAQCFYAHSTQLLINTATVLGKTDDVAAYNELLKKIKEAFVKEYMTPNGRLVSGTQTAYVLALNFEMIPEPLREQAAQRLADNVKDYDFHLTTGFLGTPYLCQVLSRYGYTDIAYKLLLQDSYPSWLYPVTRGATTIWERWDGIKPDSTFQTPAMNSYNHYAYGAIGDWMYRVAAGIDTYEDGPGYRHIRIMPHPGGGFSRMSASLQTYYGKIAVEWKLDNGRMMYDIEIPANTQAELYIPATSANAITETYKRLSEARGIIVTGMENGYVHVKAGSGKYSFSVNK